MPVMDNSKGKSDQKGPVPYTGAVKKPAKRNTPFIRTSERRDFKRCPQRWHWAWRDGLKSKRTANPLWFGQGIHLALAEWYLPGLERGPEPEETWLKFVGDESRFVPQDYEEDGVKFAEAKTLGVEMLSNYRALYGMDDQWDVIATEQTFSLIIDHPSTSKPLAEYLGTFDGVYRDRLTGELWLMEHKTAKAISVMHLELDDQAGSYFYVAAKVLRAQGLIGPDEVLAGIMYNFLRKAGEDPRPVNPEGLRTNKPVKAHYLSQLAGVGDWRPAELAKLKLDDLADLATLNGIEVIGEPSKVQPAELFLRHQVWRSRSDMKTMEGHIQSESLAMDAFRNKTLPLYKNPTTNCPWDCSFYRMCQLHESQEDWVEFAQQDFVQLDPYADHRGNRKSS